MLQTKCKNRQVSNMCGRQAHLFVLGPVGQTSPKYHKNLFTFNAAETDRTIRWTKIEEVKVNTLEQREACASETSRLNEQLSVWESDTKETKGETECVVAATGSNVRLR